MLGFSSSVEAGEWRDLKPARPGLGWDLASCNCKVEITTPCRDDIDKELIPMSGIEEALALSWGRELAIQLTPFL